ncbi:MAG: glycine cleavage system protein GcvH [Acidobacteria bacterium]|nr:glycine cleavage system protein GcvH [Acidobacteriota bacterium]
MATYPEDLYYSKDHEWVRVDGETGTIGITDHAQQQLGDVVYVELPAAGTSYSAGDSFGSVESVKAVSELYLPVAGEILESNASLSDTPEIVNSDPHGAGWMVRIRIKDAGELSGLMRSIEYGAYVKEEGGE